MKFWLKYKLFHPWKCIWKHRLRNDDHFVKGGDELTIHGHNSKWGNYQPPTVESQCQCPMGLLGEEMAWNIIIAWQCDSCIYRLTQIPRGLFLSMHCKFINIYHIMSHSHFFWVYSTLKHVVTHWCVCNTVAIDSLEGVSKTFISS